MNALISEPRRTKKLTALFTCRICQKLLKQATSISECNHSFCKDCIYNKISEENLHKCPVCNVDLGSQPLRKLRPDNKMQTMKVSLLGVYKRTPEERAARKKNKQRKFEKGKATLELCLDEPAKKITSCCQRSRKSVPTKLECLKQPLVMNKGKEKVQEPPRDLNDMCAALNFLVEAAEMDSSRKLKGVVIRSPPQSPQLRDAHDTKNTLSKSQGKKPMEETQGIVIRSPPQSSPQQAAHEAENTLSESQGKKLIEVDDRNKEETKINIWTILVPDDHQQVKSPLKPLDDPYVCIKFKKSVPPDVSHLKKYLALKLDLDSDQEVDIFLHGDVLPLGLKIPDLLKLWLMLSNSSKTITLAVGSPASDCVMKLTYARAKK